MKYRNQILLIVFSAVIICSCEKDSPPGFLGSGTLEATEVRVSALTGGIILELTKEEGEPVFAGESLAQIDVETLALREGEIQAGFKEIDAGKITVKSAIDQARENFENIDLKYKRIKTLYKKGSATQQQFDDVSTQLALARSGLTSAQAQELQLEARRQKLEASLALLNRQIADGHLTSPIKGVILEKYAEKGELSVPGRGIYKIGDLDHFWIKVYVSEEDLGNIVIGKKVSVKTDALETPLPGVVAWVSSESEFTPTNVQTRKARSELVYAVKVTLDRTVPELKIGMPAEVYDTMM